jgi:hypothetical protein
VIAANTMGFIVIALLTFDYRRVNIRKVWSIFSKLKKFGYRISVVPTLFGMNASGIALAIWFVADQPVQCPGIK